MMTDLTAAIVCLGIFLIGTYFLAAGSRRARIAEDKAKHPASRGRTPDPSRDRTGAAASRASNRASYPRVAFNIVFPCAGCRKRRMLHDVEPDVAAQLLASDEAIWCDTCITELERFEEELA